MPRFRLIITLSAVTVPMIVAFAWSIEGAASGAPSSPASATPPYHVKVLGHHPNGKPRFSSNSPTGLSPTDLASVYHLQTGVASSSSTAGKGQVVAIVDAYHDPNALSD